MNRIHITDNSKKTTNWKNAVERRYHNKRVSLSKTEIGYLLETTICSKDHADEPCSQHAGIKGVIGINQIHISRETLEAFILNAMDLLKRGL